MPGSYRPTLPSTDHEEPRDCPGSLDLSVFKQIWKLLGLYFLLIQVKFTFLRSLALTTRLGADVWA